MLDFTIQVGCAYGKFYDFEFTTNNFSETTTIGYAANFAAKIQSKTRAGRLSISENVYEKLEQEDRDKFEKVPDDSMKKYDQDGYYTLNLSEVHSSVVIKSDDLAAAKEYAKEDKYMGVNGEECFVLFVDHQSCIDEGEKVNKKELQLILRGNPTQERV